MSSKGKDVIISVITLIRKIGRAIGRQGSIMVALTVPAVLAMAAPAAAADVSSEGGLPFSIADLGWITLAAAVLTVVASLLQTIARRRRRRPLHTVVPRRTDP